MSDCGIVCSKVRDHYSFTGDRQGIAEMIDNYLEWIERYRLEGYEIFYQEETWIFKNMSPSKTWQTTTIDDISVHYKRPSGSGNRSNVCHLGLA